ncbi:MAG: protein phosphatase 2C domain-containing protein, partial [Anaerolineae bacterium]
MTAETIRTDQTRETPVTARQRARFGYRYAYARSADSRASGDPGQDYLALREDGVRLAFALCDGVGQSFYGDLAARLLGDALVDYLWELHPADSEALREDLAAFLDRLVEAASAQVAAYPLPEGLPPMLRQVLEEKRALGSESTFVAGLLDTEAGVLHLAWMGDSRLRLWGPDGEFTARLGDTFHTQERWSTRRGRVGELHTLSVPLRELRYAVAYSDGLARLDRVMTRHFRDASIQAVIDDTLLRPESDDIAFLEIWLGNRRPSERPPLKPPPDIRVDVQGGRARVWWQPVAGVAFYEVRLNDGRSFTVYSPRHALELPPEALSPDVRTVRVRGWDEEPGGWSREAALPEEVLPRPAPAAAAPPSPPEAPLPEEVLPRPAPPVVAPPSPPEAPSPFLPPPSRTPAPPPPTARPLPPV